jgi:hypothetical protein
MVPGQVSRLQQPGEDPVTPFWRRRGGGTIPVHEVRGTAALMRLTQTQLDLARRVSLQTRKTIILTRWVIALAVIVAAVGGTMIALQVLG